MLVFVNVCACEKVTSVFQVASSGEWYNAEGIMRNFFVSVCKERIFFSTFGYSSEQIICEITGVQFKGKHIHAHKINV